MVEQWPFKPLVAGSSPAALIEETRFKMGLFDFPRISTQVELAHVLHFSACGVKQDIDFLTGEELRGSRIRLSSLPINQA
jgi:hypothetical protein